MSRLIVDRDILRFVPGSMVEKAKVIIVSEPDGSFAFIKNTDGPLGPVSRDLVLGHPTKPNEIHLAVSLKQGEGTLNNRWFTNHAECWAYVQKIEKMDGISLACIAVEKGS